MSPPEGGWPPGSLLGDPFNQTAAYWMEFREGRGGRLECLPCIEPIPNGVLILENPSNGQCALKIHVPYGELHQLHMISVYHKCPRSGGGGLVIKSCPTLLTPMDYSPPGSSVHGIFQARILEWVAIRGPLNKQNCLEFPSYFARGTLQRCLQRQ